MNINELTIGQAKELMTMFDGFGGESRFDAVNSVYLSDDETIIGKYVIVRSRNEGVNCGFVENYNKTGIALSQARRLWYHEPKDKSMAWYEGVAQSGLSENSKLSTPVIMKIIMEDYSITLCTDIAIESLQSYKDHGQ